MTDKPTEQTADDAARSAAADATGPGLARDGRDLPPAARRALAEAEERRRQGAAERVHPGELPKELAGRDGPEPIRYGDWEKNGIISDF